ncbi:GNAT family N-acetyltransferase [Aeromicrobium phragmitis]|uniref:GNAT family N-acetyltransferase n=1 Tax=Aeromicrobium phragmitis TaxID=2478914 RepID=A0A3L8PPI7_9ACTN|nr:GNAT family N-acetyltransferase [Aeromicrobium phragmitis]RLV57297.1 GNAT family N-acetyltransferase [Aeromicrobium phragmitis]
MTSVREAVVGDLDAAARTLAAAFHGYPWTDWILPPDDHDERLREVQHLYLAHLAMPHGLVMVTGDLAAVAAFVPPGASLPGEAERRVVELHGDRIARLASVELRAPADPGAWTLATVGVRPDQQGRGLGSAVLRAALDLLDQRVRVGMHLETSDPRNVTLYERHGFVTSAVTTIQDGPTVWSMERPRPA